MTMVELAVVIVVVGILAAVVMPRFRNILSRSRVDEAASMIARDLEMGMSLATRQRRPVRLNCAAAGYDIVDRATPSTRYMARNVGTDADFHLTSATCSAATIDFFPNGIASGALSIAIASGPDTRTVSMSRAGQVRVTRP